LSFDASYLLLGIVSLVKDIQGDEDATQDIVIEEVLGRRILGREVFRENVSGSDEHRRNQAIDQPRLHIFYSISVEING